jgi:hypothetical protein
MFLSLEAGIVDKLASTALEERSVHKNDSPMRGGLRLTATQNQLKNTKKWNLHGRKNGATDLVVGKHYYCF